MENITAKVHEFFESKWSMITFSIVGTVFAIVEIVLFSLGIIEINGITIGDGNPINNWQIFVTTFSVTMSLFSLYFGFYVSVLNTRKSKNASLYAIVNMILFLIIDLMAGLWLVVFEYSFAIILMMFRNGFWERESYKKEKYNLKNMWWVLVITGLGAAALYFGLVLLAGESIYNNSLFPGMPPSNEQREWVWYLDALTAILGTMGSICMFFRWRLAYFFWTIITIPIVPALFVNGNYIQIFELVIWVFIDIATVLAITHQQKEYIKKKE